MSKGLIFGAGVATGAVLNIYFNAKLINKLINNEIVVNGVKDMMVAGFSYLLYADPNRLKKVPTYRPYREYGERPKHDPKDYKRYYRYSDYYTNRMEDDE